MRYMVAVSLLLTPVAASALDGEAAAPAPAPAPAAAPAPAPAPSPAAVAFDQLKTLVGTWRVADRDGHPLRIRFYTTAGGSTLVEAWEVNGRSHSLTLYHRDGDALLATHYCPQGNQPRLAMTTPGATAADASTTGEGIHIRFTLRDVTDLDAANEQHQHDLGFDVTDPARIIRSEAYADGDGTMHPSALTLVRAD